MRKVLRNVRVVLAAAGVIGLIAVAWWPRAATVDVAAVSRGPLAVTVEEEGRTRVRERYIVSAPVSGRVLRIALEPGDRVSRGEVVARVRPTPPPLLDARAEREARASIASAGAALGRARAESRRASAALAQAEREVARAGTLVAAGALSTQELDARKDGARLAQEAADAAEFAVQGAASDLRRAEALVAGAFRAGGPAVTVTAPADGVVLRRIRESETVVPAGDPLLEIGDPARLEVVADLLSSDAAFVAVGARATVRQTGDGSPLAASVRRIEPAGFTKISALGVEEQRVNVILDFADLAAACERLGDAYRVEVAIVTWEAADVLKAPTSALFREGGRWAAFVARDGRAQQVLLEIGHRSASEAEVLSGLSRDDQVIVHPTELIRHGSRLRVRAGEALRGESAP